MTILKNISSCIITIILFFSCCLGFAQQLSPIELTAPNLERGKSLMQALKMRKSSRDFSPNKLRIDLLSNLLWAANGINRENSGLRTAPSAVNWQEIDIYVALEEGLFLYNAKKNLLDPILNTDIRKHIGKQGFTADAPVGLIYVADLAKMSTDDEAKDFYSATDTGYISQNVYLFCASEGLSTVALGWVEKPELKKIMKLKDNQKIILTQPVGYPKS